MIIFVYVIHVLVIINVTVTLVVAILGHTDSIVHVIVLVINNPLVLVIIDVMVT